jgi:hypothetical protein
MIVNGHNAVEGGPGLTLEQVVAFSLEPPTSYLGREVIKQEIAKMMYGRFKIAEIIGSASGITVKAHDDGKGIFLEATLGPDTDIVDSFALRVFGKHESEYLMEEEDVSRAGEQANINHEGIKEGRVPMVDGRSAIIKASKIARAKGEHLVLRQCDGWQFSANDVQWAMRMNFDSCWVHTKGIIITTVRGTAGEYSYYLRGFATEPKTAQAA